MNIVSFGGGINSTAMLIGMWEKKFPIDLILFADTGAEQPHTYKHIQIMNDWLKERWLPEITIVENVDQNGDRLTLEQDCLKYKKLPTIAYGRNKGCSIKHKKAPQDKYCNNYQPCIDIWKAGGRPVKYIGYDAGEENRILNAKVIDMADTKYFYNYVLYDWNWYREDCIKKIQEHGIPLPGKSSCFFCPNTKKAEIRLLKKQYPELLERAIALEENAKENLTTIRGLGRGWSWKHFVEWENSQVGMCEMYDSDDMPCDCYDG